MAHLVHYAHRHTKINTNDMTRSERRALLLRVPDDVSCNDADDIALCYALRVRVLFALGAANKYAGTFMFKNPVCPLL